MGPNFTTLSENQADGQDEQADADSTATEPDEPTLADDCNGDGQVDLFEQSQGCGSPIVHTSDNADEVELFRDACLAIEASLERTLPIAFEGRWETINEKSGRIDITKYHVDFYDFQVSDRFIISGRVQTGNSPYSPKIPEYPTTGELRVNVIDSDHRGFLIGTRHVVKLDRRKRFVSFENGEFQDMGRAVLFAGKDELIEALRFAYDTSLNNPNTYVDGFIPEGSYIKDSFLYVEVCGQRFAWEFEYYSPQSTRGVQIGGTIEGVLNENRVHIKDDSLLLSILYPAGEKPINSVGLYGMGLLGDHLDIDILIPLHF